MKRLNSTLQQWPLFVLVFFTMNDMLWAQAPILTEPSFAQSNVGEGGKIARCSTGDGDCRTFQVWYLDLQGDFPVVNNLELRQNGQAWVQYTMTATGNDPSLGILYDVTVNFPTADTLCVDTSLVAGWEYRFNFADVSAAAVGENGIIYGISYLRCEFQADCITPGDTADFSVTFTDPEGGMPLPSKFWIRDDSVTWIEYPLTNPTGTPAAGLTYRLRIPTDTFPTRDLIYKFDFHGTAGKTLRAGKEFQVELRNVNREVILDTINNELAVIGLDSATKVDASYAWYYYDTLQEGSNSWKISPTREGFYRVEMELSNTCVHVSDAEYVVIDGHGGVGIVVDLDIRDVHIAVYPNPAINGLLIFDTDFPLSYLELQTASGGIVYAENNLQPGIHTISTMTYQPGLYFLHARMGQRSLTRKVLVIR